MTSQQRLKTPSATQKRLLDPETEPNSFWTTEHRSTMKPAMLLLSSLLLLSSHLRSVTPRSLLGWTDDSGRLQSQRLEEVLLRAAAAGDSAASHLLEEHMHRYLQRVEPEPLKLLDEEEEEVREAAAALLKRSEEPPLSIDLTFHLLRNMIQMAKLENQREQAQFNRKVLDEVGK